MKKILSMIAAIPVAATLFAAPAQAVSQGDIIYTSAGSCTAGFIDQQNGKMFTAAHCVRFVGERITDANGVEIGVVESIGNTGQYWAGINDWATVRLHSGQTGGNYVTGNATGQVGVGDTVCMHSRRNNGKVSCAHVIWDTGTSVILAPMDPFSILPGDSGGAAFSPGKGSVGLVSGGTIAKVVTRHPDISPAVGGAGSSF